MSITIWEFKYLVINCGHTSRLIKHVPKIQKFLEDQVSAPQLLYIEDKIFHAFSLKEKEIETIRKRTKTRRGVIVFECRTLFQALSVISFLTSLNHCSQFDVTTIYKMELIDQEVLVISFDT